MGVSGRACRRATTSVSYCKTLSRTGSYSCAGAASAACKLPASSWRVHVMICG